MNLSKWDMRFLDLASLIATWSKDKSTKVGAVIVEPKSKAIVSTGFNGFPPGVNDDIVERHERPAKYLYTEHAERNALYFAAERGVVLKGCVLYATMFPCADCARGIIRAGLVRVVAPASDRPDWAPSMEAAKWMLLEANIQLTHFGT